MSKAIDSLFTKDDLRRIEDVVKDAEAHMSGEIVPYAVYASDAYERALWRAGLLFGTLALAAFLLMHSFSRMWLAPELAEVAAGTLIAALIGVLLVYYIPAVRRFFAGQELMHRRVAQRAAEAFLAEEVFNTRSRTGILILLSLLERKVIVLGDSGINTKVQPSEWEGIVKTIVDGMHAGKPADALVEAIRQCGQLLKKEGVTIKPTDTNELSNRMRTSDR